jgi:hypothetical protein
LQSKYRILVSRVKQKRKGKVGGRFRHSDINYIFYHSDVSENI